MNILVADNLSPAAIAAFQAVAEWNTIASNPKEFTQYLADADALLVRSACKVTAEVIQQAPKLRVIGRAGVGVDNVDLAAATKAGIFVLNTPGANAIAVAEQTLGFMLGMAKRIPQANASTRAGKWEKKKYLGNELRAKTLGLLGLGAIGRAVAKRAKAFEMRIVAYNPYIPAQVAADCGAELVDLATLYAVSDYISLHMAKTPETVGMLSREAFAKMKKGVRIVNCARGELIDEAALLEALQSGQVADAALDVFSAEPVTADYPLFAAEGVVATPHIAGSTREAQENVGLQIAEQVIEFLKTGKPVNAVNKPEPVRA